MEHVVVFDIFGVIVSRSFSSSAKKLTRLLGVPEEQIRPAYEKWEKPFDLGRISDEQFWNAVQKELGTNVDWKLLNQATLESYSLIPGAREIIKSCALETQVFALSNTRKGWFEYVDGKFKLRKLFNKLFLSFEMGLLKPDPRIYVALCRELNKQFNEILYLDDEPENTATASKLGIRSLTYTDPQSGEMFLRKYGFLRSSSGVGSNG